MDAQRLERLHEKLLAAQASDKLPVEGVEEGEGDDVAAEGTEAGSLLLFLLGLLDHSSITNESMGALHGLLHNRIS